MTEHGRVRFYIKQHNGTVRDSNFESVTYDGLQVWEPVDTTFPRGANGPTKVLTGVQVIGESETGISPLNSNVAYPRTGTAG